MWETTVEEGVGTPPTVLELHPQCWNSTHSRYHRQNAGYEWVEFQRNAIRQGVELGNLVSITNCCNGSSGAVNYVW